MINKDTYTIYFDNNFELFVFCFSLSGFLYIYMYINIDINKLIFYSCHSKNIKTFVFAIFKTKLNESLFIYFYSMNKILKSQQQTLIV